MRDAYMGVDGGMHHVYIYIKKNPINPIKSGMRLINIRDDGGF